jgi:Cu/Zn superoxide dismutase
VVRYRRTAIAALAASALLLTSGAAYARELRLQKVAREAPTVSSMSWADYRGDLTDLSSTDKVFDGARAMAYMMGINDESTFRLNVQGLPESATSKDYPAHLHEGPCVAGDGAAAPGHYNTQKETGLPSPWAISDQTEVHLDFKVNSDGSAQITVTVPFIPKAGARSIVIHSDEPPPPGSSPLRLACLPLEIKQLTGRN